MTEAIDSTTSYRTDTGRAAISVCHLSLPPMPSDLNVM
jgi:hypothetical protein